MNCQKEIVIKIPGDKSISHRALLFNALTNGTARIDNLLLGEDVQSTIDCLRALGVNIYFEEDTCIITGSNGQFIQPIGPLNCGNSGTTMRLLLGLLCAHSIHVQLSGDESLSRRPMERVTRYLEPLGVEYQQSRNFAPIYQKGSTEIPFFEVDLHIASAQMKSAMLLAGIQSNGCVVRGGKNSRDHTERMLKGMGATLVQTENGDVRIEKSTIRATDIIVPNDVSSAAFFIVAGLLIPNMVLRLPNIGLNPTRDGVIRVLRQMGAQIDIQDMRVVGGEPVGDLVVKSSNLVGIEVPIDLIPSMIDEVPILALAASQAVGRMKILGAADLRKKESDRITAIVESFQELGVKVKEYPDGISIEGPQPIVGGAVHCHGDHRIIMTAAIAGLISTHDVSIDSIDAVGTSFPSFWGLLESVVSDVTEK